MLWINFLHLYQPANADGHIIKEATEMSYERLVRALEENPRIKFTLNITGCLVMRWDNQNFDGIINKIKSLIKKGQIELTGSAAYHPLLPLIPEKEAKTQIKENEDVLRYYFGSDIKLRGFFLPEMAYSPRIARVIKALGYEWLILDEIAYNGKLNQVNCEKVHKDIRSSIKVVFRSRKFSQTYVPETISKLLEKGQENFLITGTDAELYGLRHRDQTGEFEKVLKNKNLETLTISEYIDRSKELIKFKGVSSSWESTEEELVQNNAYLLWHDEKNKIHLKIWELVNLAYKTIEKYNNDDNSNWARWHFVRGIASCTFWWASAKDFRKVFGPHAWSPDEIERGTNELIRSIRALNDVTTRHTKMKAERLYLDIKKMVWTSHWNYYWKK